MDTEENDITVDWSGAAEPDTTRLLILWDTSHPQSR